MMRFISQPQFQTQGSTQHDMRLWRKGFGELSPKKNAKSTVSWEVKQPFFHTWHFWRIIKSFHTAVKHGICSCRALSYGSKRCLQTHASPYGTFPAMRNWKKIFWTKWKGGHFMDSFKSILRRISCTFWLRHSTVIFKPNDFHLTGSWPAVNEQGKRSVHGTQVTVSVSLLSQAWYANLPTC